MQSKTRCLSLTSPQPVHPPPISEYTCSCVRVLGNVPCAYCKLKEQVHSSLPEPLEAGARRPPLIVANTNREQLSRCGCSCDHLCVLRRSAQATRGCGTVTTAKRPVPGVGWGQQRVCGRSRRGQHAEVIWQQTTLRADTGVPETDRQESGEQFKEEQGHVMMVSARETVCSR